ncbi:MAG: pilin [Patescibacteria group bacterium]
MKTGKNVLVALAFFAAILIALPVFAQRTGGQTGTQYDADGTIDDKPAPIVTEIVIPGTPSAPGEESAGTLADLAQYIGIIYNFLISIIGLVAAVMIVVGGIQYLTSAGDSGKIGAAKKRITNALIGVVLALSAYTILNTINPALLTLKVPGGITGIRTEITFLPFCDKLAEQYGLTEEQITKAGPRRNPAGGGGTTVPDTRCGTAGFIKSRIRNSDGTMKDSRIWCLWRGDKAHTAEKKAEGEEHIGDYGCEDTRLTVSSDAYTLSICIPRVGITQAQLNEEYDKSVAAVAAAGDGDRVPRIETSLGVCQACNTLSDGRAALLHWPKGDESCQYWQNTANNGDPRDYDFKISKKKIIQDSRDDGSSDARRRMYYCGYSANYGKCIYAPVYCDRVSNCVGYEKAKMHYCESTAADASIDCHASETLGSSWGTQVGNAAHLLPVCEGDPCETSSSGCKVPGLAGTRNTLIGGNASTVRVAFRILTGGLTNGVDCKPK